MVLVSGESGDEMWGGVLYEWCVYVGIWMLLSYDVEFGLIYFGIFVMFLVLKFMLGGIENIYLYYNLMLVLDVEIGEIWWYY